MALKAGVAGVAGITGIGAYLSSLQTPELTCQDTPANRATIAACKRLVSHYIPHPAAWSGLASTVLAAAKSQPLPGDRRSRPVEKVVLPDGGTVSLDWGAQSRLPLEPGHPSEPIVLLLPGLNNSSRSSYIKTAMLCYEAKGFGTVALNYRGVDGLELTSPKVVGRAQSDRPPPLPPSPMPSPESHSPLFSPMTINLMNPMMAMGASRRSGAWTRGPTCTTCARTSRCVPGARCLPPTRHAHRYHANITAIPIAGTPQQCATMHDRCRLPTLRRPPGAVPALASAGRGLLHGRHHAVALPRRPGAVHSACPQGGPAAGRAAQHRAPQQ